MIEEIFQMFLYVKNINVVLILVCMKTHCSFIKLNKITLNNYENKMYVSKYLLILRSSVFIFLKMKVIYSFQF